MKQNYLAFIHRGRRLTVNKYLSRDVMIVTINCLFLRERKSSHTSTDYCTRLITIAISRVLKHADMIILGEKALWLCRHCREPLRDTFHQCALLLEETYVMYYLENIPHRYFLISLKEKGYYDSFFSNFELQNKPNSLLLLSQLSGDAHRRTSKFDSTEMALAVLNHLTKTKNNCRNVVWYPFYHLVFGYV